MIIKTSKIFGGSPAGRCLLFYDISFILERLLLLSSFKKGAGQRIWSKYEWDIAKEIRKGQYDYAAFLKHSYHL